MGYCSFQFHILCVSQGTDYFSETWPAKQCMTSNINIHNLRYWAVKCVNPNEVETIEPFVWTFQGKIALKFTKKFIFKVNQIVFRLTEYV